MPCWQLVQESATGQILHGLTRRLGHQPPWLAYAEEKKGFKTPAKYYKVEKRLDEATPRRSDSDKTLVGSSSSGPTPTEKPFEAEVDVEDPNVVTFDDYDAETDPLRFSSAKKVFISLQIGVFTGVVYLGAALYAPGLPLIEGEFGVGHLAALLPLSLFVLGYGISPMFLAPISETCWAGRNSLYMITFAIFVLLQIPTFLVDNFAGLLVLRFLAGLSGAQILAAGGATLSDLFEQRTRSYALSAWGASAVIGPVGGPLIGGFVIDIHQDWRWLFYVLFIMTGSCFLFFLLFLPETSPSNILYRKARRLRRLTGNDDLVSPGELASEGVPLGAIIRETLSRPFILNFTEPIVFLANTYTALTYGLLYIWLESFPIVFIEGYGMSNGQNGLAFLGILVCANIAFLVVCLWTYFIYEPAYKREGADLKPEIRMQLGMIGCWFIPISLLIWGWSANRGHWMGPVIGSGLFSIGLSLIFQGVLIYCIDVYSKYAASILAGNDLFRAVFGATFPLFARTMYTSLGTSIASTVLAAVGLAFCAIPFLFYCYGARIRALSRHATMKT